MEELPDGSKLFTFNEPQREGREGYVSTFFSMYLKLANVLCAPEHDPIDGRGKYMTKFIISLVPGKKNRDLLKDELKNKINAEIEEFKKLNGHEPDNAERGRIELEASLDTLGLVSDFVDKHIGVSNENKLGFVLRT